MMIPLYAVVLMMIGFIILVIILGTYIMVRFTEYVTDKVFKESDNHYDQKVRILVNEMRKLEDNLEAVDKPYFQGYRDGVIASREQMELMK